VELFVVLVVRTDLAILIEEVLRELKVAALMGRKFVVMLRCNWAGI
jgi:hypothetical protein